MDSHKKTHEEKRKIATEIIEYCNSSLDIPEENVPDFKEQDWTTKYKSKLFNDSVHKTVVLNPLEVAIIQTPEFFRLKGIKQLGGAYHVYPGAVHTRFEHSIGVCHLAGEFMRKLKEKYHDKIEDTDTFCVRLAGLCHDLGHGPFSHMFERVTKQILTDRNEDNKVECLKHEELSVLIFKWILVKHRDVLVEFVGKGLNKDHVEMIVKMIVPDDKYLKDRSEERIGDGKQNDDFLFEIVANKKSGLDVDKWDYFTRDCHHLGLTTEFDYWRTMELSSLVKVTVKDIEKIHIGFMKKEIHNIHRMFRTRSVLHHKAYVHQVVDGIEFMIADIMFEAKDAEIFHGQSLRTVLNQAVLKEVPHRNLSGYCSLTDSILDIIRSSLPPDSKAHGLMTRLMERDLYWCCYDTPFPFNTWTEEDKKNMKDREKQLKSILKEEEKDMYAATEAVKISYASEVSANPLKGVYFYEQCEGGIPDGFILTEEVLEETVSKLHTPKVYAEYRLRGYCKLPKPNKEKFKDKVLVKMNSAE